tara:strand:+ start:489 stop:674 length:186 start_codon:yes stop_codon:yes gene_type:complete
MKQTRQQRRRLLRRIQKLLQENKNLQDPSIPKSTFGLEIVSKEADTDTTKELAETEEEDNA